MATTTTTTTTTKKDIEATVGDDGTLILEFRHGETLRLRPEMLNPEIQRAALLHGLKQKLVDAAAISRDTATGRAATIVTKYDAVREIFDRITGAGGKPRRGTNPAPVGLVGRAACSRGRSPGIKTSRSRRRRRISTG